MGKNITTFLPEYRAQIILPEYAIYTHESNQTYVYYIETTTSTST